MIGSAVFKIKPRTAGRPGLSFQYGKPVYTPTVTREPGQLMATNAKPADEGGRTVVSFGWELQEPVDGCLRKIAQGLLENIANVSDPAIARA